MLLNALRNEPTIMPHLCADCTENGIGVGIDPTIVADKLLIIKVDEFYHSNVHPQPKSPDCLIVQQCEENTYSIYIAELRDIDSPDGFSIKEIVEKFETCLGDFMSERFGLLFHNDRYQYRSIKLLFVTDPYGYKKHPEKQNKDRGLKLENLLSMRIPMHFGKRLYIEPMLPNPTIKSCS
jgi:hypothetical protein